MKQRSARLRLFGAAAVVALAITGCSSNESTSTSDIAATGDVGSGGTGGTFIDGAQLCADNLTNYDPGLVQTLDESQVTSSLYDALTDFDFRDKLKPAPSARRWSRTTRR